MLHVAKLINETRDAAEWGVTFDDPKIDLDKLRNWKEGVVEKLTGGIGELCKARGVKLIGARGRFKGSQTLVLERNEGGTDELTFNHAVIATGSSPVVPGPLRVDDERVMDFDRCAEPA